MSGSKFSYRNGNKRVGGFLKVLRRHLPELQKRFGVRSLGIFGSYVSGAPRKGSDLDVLVEFVEEPSLFEFLELEASLSKVMGINVDLVMRSALKPRIGRQILSELVSL